MITRTIKRIWNFILSGFKGRSQQKRMLQGFAALDEIEKKGLLTWMRGGRYLLIEQSLATSFLATGNNGAKNIFTMIALWQNFHLSSWKKPSRYGSILNWQPFARRRRTILR